MRFTPFHGLVLAGLLLASACQTAPATNAPAHGAHSHGAPTKAAPTRSAPAGLAITTVTASAYVPLVVPSGEGGGAFSVSRKLKLPPGWTAVVDDTGCIIAKRSV